MCRNPEWAHCHYSRPCRSWNQMLKGRFSTQWRHYQDCYLGTRATKKKNGITWMTGLIYVIFQEWWKLWELCNSDRWGRDLASKTQAESRQTLRELTLLYETHQNRAGQMLQWLFDIPLQTRMQSRTNALRQWLNTWKPMLEKSYTTALETGWCSVQEDPSSPNSSLHTSFPRSSSLIVVE